MDEAFAGNQFLIRQKVFTFPHRKFRVYNSAGKLILYSKMKAFKLKEDIRIFADETETKEVVKIQARSIIDFSAAYDVIDSETQQRLGSLRRKGWKSMLRDSWEILSAEGNVIGKVQEDSTFKAIVRRFIDAASFLMPQKFHVDLNGQTAATFKQNFNVFVPKLTVDFSADPDHRLDRLFGLASGILVMAIEGRQQ